MRESCGGWQQPAAGFHARSHKLQPCNVGVFSSMKAAYHEQVEQKYRRGAGTVGKEHFKLPYSEARMKALSHPAPPISSLVSPLPACYEAQQRRPIAATCRRLAFCRSSSAPLTIGTTTIALLSVLVIISSRMHIAAEAST